jgi:hypothetical protein
MDLDHEKFWRSPFIIGAIGSIVALRFAPGESWIIRFVNVLNGAGIAGFFSPAASEYFALTSPAMYSAMAFAFGLFGMNLTSAIYRWLKNAQLSDILPWIRKE